MATMANDHEYLAALGVKQELRRNFSPLSMLGLAFAILNSWTALSTSLSLALPSGGPTSGMNTHSHVLDIANSASSDLGFDHRGILQSLPFRLARRILERVSNRWWPISLGAYHLVEQIQAHFIMDYGLVRTATIGFTGITY